MQGLAFFVSFALVLLGSHCRAQELDLSDALGDPDPTKKPTPAKKPAGDDGFNLEDAFNDDEPRAGPPPYFPEPGSQGDTGGLSDSDLYDGKLPTSKPEAAPQGMLAGILSAVGVAIVGALSSFIAYQKKKFCFKPGDQENVNMETQQAAYAEPPVQRTLIQKS